MDFINGHDKGLVLTGADDGSVRVWRRYADSDSSRPVLVTAWQALSDMLQSSRGELAAT